MSQSDVCNVCGVTWAKHGQKCFAPSAPENTNTEAVRSASPRSEGVALIAAERRRQIENEGWTPEHDDKHDCGELAQAAGSYLLALYPGTYQFDIAGDTWPWEMDWWKPSADPIRNLSKAGALIAAEIDRLQRLVSASSVRPRAPGEPK